MLENTHNDQVRFCESFNGPDFPHAQLCSCSATPSQRSESGQVKSVQMMVTDVLLTNPKHSVRTFMNEFPDVEGNIGLHAYHGVVDSSSSLTRKLRIA